MDLRQLTHFTTVAKTGSYRRAAELLHISQPSLTVSIRKLEEELGLRLLVRGARGAALTDQGAAVIGFAEATVAQAERLRRAATGLRDGGRGRLTIGFIGSATFALVPRLIARFRSTYPQIELVLKESTSIEIVQAVESGAHDVGIIRLPLSEAATLGTTVIEHDELVVAMPDAHPAAHASVLGLQDLASEPFVTFPQASALRTIILMTCYEAGFVPTIAQEAAHLHTILSLVRSGLGVALVPRIASHALPGGVRLVPLARPVRIQTGLVLPRSGASIAAENFVTMAGGPDEPGDRHAVST